jgi:MFS family permease
MGYLQQRAASSSGRVAEQVGPAAGAEPGYFYGYTVVAAACLSMVLVFSVHYSFGIFFKPLSAEFGWTRAMTSGAFSLVWITQGLLAIVMGGLNDRFGPRIVLTVCGLLIGAGYLLMSQITAVWQLYLFYGVMVGAGLGGTFVPLTSTTARWFVARRGIMTGIVAAGVGVGTLIGPPVVNWLIGGYNWRVAYLILGSIVLVGVAVAAQFLRRDPAQMGERPYGERERVPLKSNAGGQGLSLKEAVHTRQFWVMFAVFLCYGFSLSAILLHLAPHATDLGISAANAARILAVLGGASVVGKVLLGSAVDRIGVRGNKYVYVVSFLLMIVSLFCLVPGRQVWILYLFAVMFGFAYGGLATAHSPLVAWLFGMRQHGLIFGVSFNGWTVGCAIGPIVAGYIFDVAHSYQLAFSICAAVSIIGLVLTVLLSPVELEPSRVMAPTH